MAENNSSDSDETCGANSVLSPNNEIAMTEIFEASSDSTSRETILGEKRMLNRLTQMH